MEKFAQAVTFTLMSLGLASAFLGVYALASWVF